MTDDSCIDLLKNRMMEIANRAVSFMPEEYRGEMWVYAAGYVFLYTLLMLFCMSTFGFICIMVYTMLMTMLILRYFGLGPLASCHTSGRLHRPPTPATIG
uniref:Uncharacterized protein n=1 Tax=Cuerna arida TaxID=1464854 RepID=A0A1B6EI83_9HEMI